MGDVKAKIDGRTADARRLKSLIAEIDEKDMQAAVLRRLAANTVLELQNIERRILSGEGDHGDALVRAGNSLTRTLDSLNALTAKPKSWISEQEAQEIAERDAYLNSLSEPELLELRAQVTGTAPPLPTPTVYGLTDEERAERKQRIDADNAELEQKKKDKELLNESEGHEAEADVNPYLNCGVTI